MSTGSEAFSLLTCLDYTKFVLLSFFTPIETIWLKIWAKQPLRNVKNPLPVDVRRSKTSLLKFPINGGQAAMTEASTTQSGTSLKLVFNLTKRQFKWNGDLTSLKDFWITNLEGGNINSLLNLSSSFSRHSHLWAIQMSNKCKYKHSILSCRNFCK